MNDDDDPEFWPDASDNAHLIPVLLAQLPSLSGAVDCTKDEHAKAHLLEGMRVILDAAQAMIPKGA